MDDSGGAGDETVLRVSDAMGDERSWKLLPGRLSAVVVWLLVDADRWLVVGLLVAGVYGAVVLVGVFGPWTQVAYLLEGTAISDAYIEMQPGIINVIVVTLAINQLVLAPELGPVSRAQARLEDTLAHKTEVENVAGVDTSPVEPAAFLATVVAATRDRAGEVAAAVGDLEDDAARDRVQSVADEVAAEADRVAAAVEDQQFGRIEMLGAAMHLDASEHLNELRGLENEVSGSLSTAQEKALADVVDALETATVSREYFRTLYVRAEFVRFSRAVLYTGLPALVVAHLAVGVVGPGVLPGSTLGVRNLLWFEAGTFAFTVLPVCVVVSYVARLVTLAETSLFIGPFLPEGQSESGTRAE